MERLLSASVQGCNSSSQEFAKGAVWPHFTDEEAEAKGG